MKRKPKILLITNLYPMAADHAVGDVTYALHNFVTCWSTSAVVMVIRPRLRLNIRAFSASDLFSRSVQNQIDGITVHTLTCMHAPRMRIFMHKSLLKLLAREGFVPDIIISHRGLNFSAGDQLSTLLSIPHIVGIHNSCLQSINRYKDILSRSDSIACRSFSIKRRFLEKLPEFSDKVFIANSGIGKDKILRKADFIKKADSIKNNKIKIISVCGLIPLKNIDIVLKALSDLSSDINWHYTIIGDGPERASLEKLAKSLSINGKVSFMGYIENSRVYDFLDESNVFTMVSSPETFGLSYLEAMARGNIVIGTKGWGIDGIVIDGVNGYLCDEVSAVDTRNKIIEIISMTRTERIKMQNDIYMTIKDYTIKEMSQVYFDVIEQCIQGYKENTNHSKGV